jgi:sugar phosphate isomerase/epimerase
MTTITRRRFLATTATAAGLGMLPAALPATGRWHGQPAASATQANDKPRFRLGLVTYNLAATWTLNDLLKACKAAGISPVEFRTTHKHGVEPSLSKEHRQEVRQKCADAGIEIWGCGTTCEFQSPNPAEVQRQIETCKQFVQLVADLGGRGVKVRPNGLPRDVPVEKTLEQIGKALVPCGKAAEDAGVEIWVEVHGGGTQLPENMKKIMEQCGHPKVGITWNSNPTDLKNGSVTEGFQLLWPWIRSCHINELYKDAAGTYPYRELFRLFRSNGYDRATLIEVGRTIDNPDLGTEMLRYYKALWTELNRG